MPNMLGRILLAATAVLLAVATGLELRAEFDYQDGQDLFAAVSEEGLASVAPEDIERARDRLERASDLRPGTTALVAQVFLERSAGRPAEAEALARRAVGRESENVATWQALFATTRDAEEREQAERELLRLDPLRGER